MPTLEELGADETPSLEELGSETTWLPNQNDLRIDGSRKGSGFLGILKRPDGKVSSEISVGVNIDGKEVEIPSLVPTLDDEEIAYLTNKPIEDANLFKTPMGKRVLDKAIAHAKKRIATGKSPFAQEGEQTIETTPTLEELGEPKFRTAGPDISPITTIRKPLSTDTSQGFLGKTAESARRGWRAMDIDFLYNDVIDGKITEQEADKASAEFERIEQENPVEGKNFASKIWYATARMVPGMARGYVEGAKYGAAGAGLAAAAGQAGPQALAPEEVVTVPGAYAAGQSVGSLIYWSKQGRGAIYREARKQGVSPKTAGLAASAGGPLYGAIEFSQVDKIIPGVRVIKGQIPKIILGILKRTGLESLEEGEQQVVTEISQSVGKLVDKKIDASDLPEEAKNAAKKGWQATYQSIGPMALLQVPGAAVSLAGADKTAKEPTVDDVIRQDKIQQAAEEEDTFNERAQQELDEQAASHQIAIKHEIVPTLEELAGGGALDLTRLSSKDLQREMVRRGHAAEEAPEEDIERLQALYDEAKTEWESRPIEEREPWRYVENEKTTDDRQEAGTEEIDEQAAAGATEKEYTTLNKRYRRKLIAEVEEEIKGHGLYQDMEEARGESQADIGPGFYYVPEDLWTEVEDVIGKPVGRGSKLQQMFTSDATAGAKPFDVALQEAKMRTADEEQWSAGGREGFDIGPGEFARRVKDAVENKGKGRINEWALSRAEAGDPYLEMLREKYEGLKAGLPPEQIDDNLMELGDRIGLEPVVYEDLLISAEARQVKAIKGAKTSEEREAIIEAEARRQLEIEDRFEGERTAKEILEANGLADEVAVETVEGIDEEGLPAKPDDDIPFERRRNRPTGVYLSGREKSIIRIAMGGDIETGYHEGYHAVRDRLTENDIKVLDAEYQGDTEREAREFAEYAAGKRQAPSNYIGHIWKKLKAMLTRIKNAIEGRGYKTAEDIFEGIKTGTVEKEAIGATREGVEDESKRAEAADEKHARGDAARAARDERRTTEKGQPQFERSKDKIKKLGKIYVSEEARLEAKKAKIRKKAGIRGKVGMFHAQVDKETPWIAEDWKPAAPAEMPKGRPVTYWEPKKRQGPVVEDQKIQDDIYEANASKEAAFRRLGMTLSNAMGTIGEGIENRFNSISQSLMNIHPALKMKLRDLELRKGQRTTEHFAAVEPYIKATRKMKGRDWKDFDLAVKNGDWDKVAEILKKYPKLEESLDARGEVHDDIFGLANEVGMEIDRRSGPYGHFHRRVRDPDGLANLLRSRYGRTNIWSYIESAMKKRQDQAGGRALSAEEKGLVIDTSLRGFMGKKIWLSLPGGAKERTLFRIDAEINDFYYNTREAEVLYINDMHEAIAAREFFGKQTRQIQNLKAEKSRLMTRLYKASTRQGRRTGDEGGAGLHLSQVRVLLEEVNAQLDQLTHGQATDSIGNYVLDLVAKQLIEPEQEEILQRKLVAYFQPVKGNKWINWYKQMAYITHIGDFIHAFSNLYDYGAILYRDPLHTLPATARALIGKSPYKLAETGLQPISFEINDIRSGIDGIMKWAGWKIMDEGMKNIYADVVLSRYRQQARNTKNLKPGTELMDRLTAIFGSDTAGILDDLKNGTKTERTKKLVFNEHLDRYPSTRSEQTSTYLTSNWWRAAATLRGFAIKNIEWMRNEILRDFSKHPKRNLKNLIWLAASMTAAGAGVEALKDLIKGRKINWGQNIIDAWLSMFLFSRYGINILTREGPAKMAIRAILPPTRFIDAPVTTGIALIKYLQQPNEKTEKALQKQTGELIRNMPLVGEPYYNWFGEGRRKELEKQRKEREKQPW